MSGPAQTKDFFISYTGVDVEWARRIAKHLEEAGYTTLYQERDFGPGDNFIAQMHKAMRITKRTIAVLSPEYLLSEYTEAEWTEAARRDPTGKYRLLLLIRVRDCNPDGMLGSRVYCDLVGLDEVQARERMLEAAQAAATSPLPPPSSQRSSPVPPQSQLEAHDLQVTQPAKKKSKKGRNVSQDKSFQMGKVICPFCFRSAYPGECAVVSARDGSVIKPKPQGWGKFPSRLLVSRLPDDATRQCPHCSHVWPQEIERAENHFIAVVGAVGSGKSHFLATVNHQLVYHPHFRQAMGVAGIRQVNYKAGHYYREYYDFLSEKLIPYQTTSPALLDIGEPLIYQLNFSVRKGEGKLSYLYLYEVDNMESELGVWEFARFLLHVSAIILISDPLAMRNIRKYINPLYYKGGESNYYNSTIGLEAILYAYSSANDMDMRKEKISLPIAVTISKSDLLQFADPQRRSGIFAYPSYDEASLSLSLLLDELAEVSNDVQKLLQFSGEDGLITLAQDYLENVGFFAISATGYPPDPVTKVYPDIKQLRCLDPLLWILLELGVIQAE